MGVGCIPNTKNQTSNLDSKIAGYLRVWFSYSVSLTEFYVEALVSTWWPPFGRCWKLGWLQKVSDTGMSLKGILSLCFLAVMR